MAHLISVGKEDDRIFEPGHDFADRFIAGCFHRPVASRSTMRFGSTSRRKAFPDLGRSARGSIPPRLPGSHSDSQVPTRHTSLFGAVPAAYHTT